MILGLLPVIDSPSSGARKVGFGSQPDSLFVYYRAPKDAPEDRGGTLQGVWLPSGRRISLDRPGAPRFSTAPERLRVSPGSRFVAFVLRDEGWLPYAFWAYDVASRRFIKGTGLQEPPRRLEWLNDQELFQVGNGYIATIRRAGADWEWIEDWPAGTVFRRREEALKRLEVTLDRREPKLGHDVVWLSPDGARAAVMVGPEPKTPAVWRRRFALYDARTLRRLAATPEWTQTVTDPAPYAFAGWARGAMALVGPSDGVDPPRALGLLLLGPGVRRTYALPGIARREGILPGIVGYVWSMAGNPGLDPRRNLATPDGSP